MLECAIPQCEGREKFLRSGTLHLIDCNRGDGVIGKKMIWLCARCTQEYTVQTWRPVGEQIRPRANIPVEFVDVLGNVFRAAEQQDEIGHCVSRIDSECFNAFV